MVESKEWGKGKDNSQEKSYGAQILLLHIYSKATDILHVTLGGCSNNQAK